MFLGVDTGGTFTDFVLMEAGTSLRTHKVLSTPEAPEQAILQGIAELGLQQAVAAGQVNIVHGSTVATNAALEGKGVRTAFITNRGFRDLLTIARQTRPQLYSLAVQPREAPVPRELCLECGGRVDANGAVVDPLTDKDIAELCTTLATLRPGAVAICFLFSFLDEDHEARLEQALKSTLPDVFICRSSDVLPEYGEYERGIATWLNASLGPLVEGYLLRLRAGTSPCRLSVMQSSGGIMAAEQASRRAVNLLLSGPAGGLAAARALASATGLSRLMTFDMGGTSTDVALIEGDIRLSAQGSIGQWPVAVPMVDMHTIGAGGGSIAWCDEGGLLHVGPQSAGASPGPACYGRGGQKPTVTDANIVLGRLPGKVALGGGFCPDTEAATEAVACLAQTLGLNIQETARGIINLANEHMARALRVISVEQGYNPADFHLCCFGGAGGLHLCTLARALGMSRALIPANAGVLSALGMLLAPVERQFSRTYTCLLEDIDRAQLERLASDMRGRALDELASEGFREELITLTLSADLRYRGQSSTLNLPWADSSSLEKAFSTAHARRFGHDLEVPVELVNLRLQATAPGALAGLPETGQQAEASPMDKVAVADHPEPVPVYRRSELSVGSVLAGPAIVVENTATSFIDAGWVATMDTMGNLLLASD